MVRPSVSLSAILLLPFTTPVLSAVITRISCSSAATHLTPASSIITCPDDSASACLLQLGPHEPASALQDCFSSAACTNAVDPSDIPDSQICYLYTSADEDVTEEPTPELKMRRRRPAPIPMTARPARAIRTASPEPTEYLAAEPMNHLFARDSASYDASCSTISSYTSKVCVTYTSLDYSSSCAKSVFSTATCRDGWLCETGGCMELDNSMDTAGIIVAIVFASFITIAVALMCFYCCRERANDKKIAARQEAEAIAKAAVRDQKKADAQPLMTGGQPNPFQDQH